MYNHAAPTEQFNRVDRVSATVCNHRYCPVLLQSQLLLCLCLCETYRTISLHPLVRCIVPESIQWPMENERHRRSTATACATLDPDNSNARFFCHEQVFYDLK